MKNEFFRITLATGVTRLALSLWQIPVTADGPSNQITPNCLSCHENLYLNYDTGKHYCVSEASDRYVNCHGGDPQATTMEEAHLNRSAHPMLMGDATQCAECHLDDCAEHVDLFAEFAGMSDEIYIAAPLTPSQQAQELSQTIEKQSGIPFYILYLSGVGLLIVAFIIGALIFQARCNSRQS